MEFTNRFHVPLPLEETWKLMLDVPRILPCLPGASLKDTLGENKYLGSVSVKLGPIKLSFDGQAELVRQDDEQHIAWLRGSGLDPKGRGSAQSEFSFALTPAAAGGTDVTVTTQLQLSGAVAQYGRGSGMIAEVAGHILKQFEANLAASLHDDAPAPAAPAPAPAGAGLPAGAMPRPADAAQPAAPAAVAVSTPEAQALMLQAQAVLAQAQAVLAATQQALHQSQRGAARQAARPKELNMLSIGLKAMWSQFKMSLGGLFGRR
ncbi:Carbon monoxide dehydrogenase subunit G (CoxG) [Pigmentiphaga humi]|uniref:Carbon monoxide dehydrogenase subunit G (CoxG) n=1 Tax=Pigmentiphaga humi TaxID=2478468 RepID=A0A3P4AZ29_9BURK|nr:SRPBCC family protein [Pigmentiphaga humi]VCU68616.1 Carbon monoxide dehydrogenase subunit G (CoxG) [Pigmentiphaga humi]